MPLNFNENENPEKEHHAERGPLLHQPGRQKSVPMKSAITVIVLCTILLGGAWAYKSGLIKKFTQPRRDVPVAQAVSPVDDSPSVEAEFDTSHPMSTAPQPLVEQKPFAATIVPSGGVYTIFIGRHRTQAIADTESGRWLEAGYQSFVSESDGWFRVSIGVFERKADADPVVEKLRDGFEGGYWVSNLH